MPKQKKQCTLEEVAERLRELNSQPIPYRRMMDTDHGRRAGTVPALNKAVLDKATLPIRLRFFEK